ncbi:MAG: DUF327 family protein [Spirochaetales bacterium]
MERIDFPGGFFPVPRKPLEKKETKGLKKAKFLSFLDLNGEVQEAEGLENTKFDTGVGTKDLEKYLDQVHQLGEELKSEPTLQRVLAYKEAVRSFLRVIIKTCYRVEEKTSSKGILNRKKYTQIRVINDQLERLAASVMRDQKEQLDILKRVDEIYGALVDLMQ